MYICKFVKNVSLFVSLFAHVGAWTGQIHRHADTQFWLGAYLAGYVHARGLKIAQEVEK